MTSRIGQSSIEYLVTYGWMLLAVSMVGGVVYTTVQPPCSLQVTNGYGSKISVEQAAVTGGNELSAIFNSGTYLPLQINSITVEDTETGEAYQTNRTVNLRSGESKAVDLVRAERTSGCTEMQLGVNFDEGPLKNQVRNIQIQAPVQIIGEIIRQLKISGGQINSLDSSSTIHPANTTLCFGGACNSTEGPETSEYVSRSGDEMTGTLRTSLLEAECVGNLCAQETGTLPGNLSNQNNTMDGTLNTTEIKPSNNLCIGETCQ